jgi:hypothetical protein
MKRNGVCISKTVLLLGFLVVMAGCVSNTPKTAKIQGIDEVFDDTVPENQRAILYVPGGNFDIVEFSGQAVKWYTVTTFGSTTVAVPSGMQRMRFHYYETGYYHMNNREISVFFEPGHNYQIVAVHDPRLLHRDTMHFGIYDIGEKKYATPMPGNIKTPR